MKTKIFLGICAALTLAGAAHAVYLNPQGAGEVLVYPYYTVNGGNSTLLSIANPTGDGKAVKVRFLEAQDGRDTLDFNVYLSPYDMWVAQVVKKGDGAAIFTNDNSCTVPQLPKTEATALPFSTAKFDGSSTWGTDGGPTTIDRTREGSIEIIEMGTVTNATHGTLRAITHQAGIPADCAQVVSAWDEYWKTNASTDLAPATGGLFGSGTILNVSLGTVEMYNAEAISQFNTPGTLPMHTAPGSDAPTIASGSSTTSLTFVNDAIVSTPFSRGIDAVSSLFMADRIVNEYWTSANIGASSEWVLSFPTKRFYTDPHYFGDTPSAETPFDQVFGAAATKGSCSPFLEEPFNREESTVSVSFPEMPPQPDACFATQLLTFAQTAGQPSTIFGSPLTVPALDSPYADGWASLNLIAKDAAHKLAGNNGNVFYGLPIAGFWAAQLINGNDGGALANFTALSRHKMHTACDRSDPSKPCS